MKAKRYKPFISIAVSVLLILSLGFGALDFLESIVQDTVYQKPGITHPDIVVIGIDERALEKFGPFQQWSRNLMADAVNILNRDREAKPAVIAIDVMYTEEGADKEADTALVKAAANGNNLVLASYVLMGSDISLNRVVTDYLKPFPALEQHVSYGLVNAISDAGVIRNVLLSMRVNDEVLYSFPRAIYNMYTASKPDPFLDSNDEAYIVYTGLPGDYYGDRDMGISFADIFEDDFEPSIFADSIVLIGPYAVGLMDSYETSIAHGEQMYGVEIHANALQMMLDGQFKTHIHNWVRWSILILLILIGMTLAEFVDVRILLVLFIAIAAGYYAFALWLYERGHILTLFNPIAALVLVYAYQLVYGYALSAMEKARLRSTFKKYVDPKLVDRLIESGEADSDEVGRKRHIAVLFVDVRGFTPMTEALRDTPELIVQTLNEYLELTSTAVFNNGGSVDKFVGDATMALFNGFVPLDDYEYKAVRAAWDIVQGAEKVNASIKEKYGIDIGFGVGVNCGEAIVGNLGPSFRKDYTAIGDTVNTAARLEANAQRSQVLISRQVYEAVKDRLEAESIGEIPLKGKSIPLEIFSVTHVR